MDAQAVGTALRALVDAERAGVPLPDWYADAIALSQRLQMEAAELPEDVWHWLSDADTRRKDTTFAAEQNRRILEVVATLEHGEWPRVVESTPFPRRSSSLMRATPARLALTVLLCIVTATAVTVVVAKPSLDVAKIDYRRVVLRDVASRLQSFKSQTGSWPASFEELAPPRCVEKQACRLSREELARIAGLTFSSADAGVTLSFEGEQLTIAP